MSRRLHPYTMGCAFAAMASAWVLKPEVDTDPFKPVPRSKGEKARNRKNRAR